MPDLEYEDLVREYSNGMIGDMLTKKRLSNVLNSLISQCVKESMEIDDNIISIVK